ncbi:uncharacterized protein LOC131957009 [Physella acuta]|uniref:uncharacterized protein LOC131957009 n=1 Tax=Physella acuta TaxID=109671 RepID=UPI0027DBC564|nr:uncharacterized protein LOC131957009 [Physella acuta]
MMDDISTGKDVVSSSRDVVSTGKDVVSISRDVVSRLREESRRNPLIEAIVSYDEDMVRTAITLEELCTMSARFAYVLKQEGVLPGDYVASTLPVSPEAAVVTFGIMFAGAAPVNLDLSFKNGSGFTHVMARTKARLVVVRDAAWDNVLNFLSPYTTIPSDETTPWADLDLKVLPHLKRMLLVRRSGILASLGCCFFLITFSTPN